MCRKISILLLICCFFAACKTTSKPVRPMEKYETLSPENPTSVINIPVRIDKNSLERQINAQIGGMIYEDNNLKDDGLQVRVQKRDLITLDVKSTDIFYQVPVDLWLKKSFPLGNVEADGALNLEFKTAWQLQENWSLVTVTEVVDYQWLKKPKLKLGFANIPIETIANIALNKMKDDLTKTIDEQAKEALDLRKQIKEVWWQLHDPFELDADYQTWLLPNPESLSLTPINIDNDTIETTIIVETKPEIKFGGKPVINLPSTLPNFVFNDIKNDDFKLNLSTEIPFTEAERLAKMSMVGETFTSGKQSVKVENMEIFGQGNKLVIGTLLSGKYNGWIYMKGKPIFNEKRNKIELDNLDFDFSTQRFLLNSLSWLFKGTIKKKMQESMDFYLNYNVEELKKMIQDQLKSYEIAEGIELTGGLNELAVQKVYITTEAIRLTVVMEGNLQVEMKDL